MMRHAPHRRRPLLPVLIAALGIISSCSLFPLTIRMSDAEIQQKLAEGLPPRRTYLSVFEVSLANPRVTLGDRSTRIEVGLDVDVGVRLGFTTLNLHGSVDGSGGVRYERSSGSIYLTDPKIERLEFANMPSNIMVNIREALTRAMAEYYRTHPIYVISSTGAKNSATKYILREIAIEKGKLVVKLGL